MFKNMRIGARLGLGFGLLVLILALVGSYAINSVQKIDDSLDVMVNDRLPKIIQANEWCDGVNAVARILRNAILFEDPNEIQGEINRLPGERARMDEMRNQLRATIRSTEGKATLQAADELAAPMREMQDQIGALALNNEDSAATALLIGAYREIQFRYFDRLEKVLEFQQRMGVEDGQVASALAGRTVVVVISLLIIGIILAIAIAIAVTISITTPVNNAINIADQLSHGKTDMDIVVDRNDEMGMLLTSLQNMVNTIKGVTQEAMGLIDSANDGNLSHRGNAAQFEGDWSLLVGGVNDILDAVVTPIQEALLVFGPGC